MKKEICAIRVTLIRHGATAANREGRYIGKTDETLSEEGIKALQQYKGAGKYPAADTLFSSPMKRCLETAQILYPGQTPMLIQEWEEMDFGAFEGHNYKELSSDPRYQQWIDSGGILPFPEGESREDFIRRSVAGWESMLKNLSIQNATAIVHGGTIMALLSHFLGGDYFDYQVKCGQGYTGRIVFTEGTQQPEWLDWKPLGSEVLLPESR